MEIDISTFSKQNLSDRRIFSGLHRLTFARMFYQSDCKKVPNEASLNGLHVFIRFFFQKYFVFCECQADKYSVITDVWSTLDGVFFGWICCIISLKKFLSLVDTYNSYFVDRIKKMLKSFQFYAQKCQRNRLSRNDLDLELITTNEWIKIC